jgi:hypothetical protein
VETRLRYETDFDDVVMPAREAVPAWFRDKLSPPRRWLERQVGRPWRLVRGELFERFDTRTTPGRHIIFCHVLPWVEGDRWLFARTGWFTVDRHGILRILPRLRSRCRPASPPMPRPESELEAWLGGRRVGERGESLFWFELTGAGAYRQHRRLSEVDALLWRSLPRWFREKHDPSAPPPDPRTRT